MCQMSYRAGHGQNETKAAATADKLGLLGIVFVTGDGRITGPRTPRQAVYTKKCAGSRYGSGDTDTVVGRKDLLQIHLFRQVGDVPGSGQRPSWSSSAKASELAVTRPEYDDGLCHFPHAPVDNSQEQGIMWPQSTRPDCEEWRDCPTSRRQPRRSSPRHI